MAEHKLSKSKRGPYYLLIGPYRREVVEAIKTLPAAARSFDDRLRAWRIDEDYYEQAQALLDEID